PEGRARQSVQPLGRRRHRRRGKDWLSAARDLTSLLRRSEGRPGGMPGPPRAAVRPREHRCGRAGRSHGNPVRTVAAAVAIALGLGAQAPGPAIPPGAEHAYLALKDRVDGADAMNLVRFMDAYWRIAGNPGFNASVDEIRDTLRRAGLEP